MAADSEVGPVLFAYDGSKLAKLAIEEAARQLAPGRDAVVVTIWEPFNVQFVPVAGAQIDASVIDSIRMAAEDTVAEGVAAAEAAGFRAHGVTLESAPTWTGLVEEADKRNASVIVLGSHGRHGLSHALLGSVAEAVAQHSKRSVLITHSGE